MRIRRVDDYKIGFYPFWGVSSLIVFEVTCDSVCGHVLQHLYAVTQALTLGPTSLSAWTLPMEGRLMFPQWTTNILELHLNQRSQLLWMYKWNFHGPTVEEETQEIRQKKKKD